RSRSSSAPAGGRSSRVRVRRPASSSSAPDLPGTSAPEARPGLAVGRGHGAEVPPATEHDRDLPTVPEHDAAERAVRAVPVDEDAELLATAGAVAAEAGLREANAPLVEELAERVR